MYTPTTYSSAQPVTDEQEPVQIATPCTSWMKSCTCRTFMQAAQPGHAHTTPTHFLLQGALLRILSCPSFSSSHIGPTCHDRPKQMDPPQPTHQLDEELHMQHVHEGAEAGHADQVQEARIQAQHLPLHHGLEGGVPSPNQACLQQLQHTHRVQGLGFGVQGLRLQGSG